MELKRKRNMSFKKFRGGGEVVGQKFEHNVYKRSLPFE